MHTILSGAKINLRLKVVGRRADGYHLLSMLNVITDLADTLVISYNDSKKWQIDDIEFSEYVSDPEEISAVIRDPNHSLILKAAELFCREFEFEIGGIINIRKAIPAGAGLGGGSSNAAAILFALMLKYKERFKVFQAQRDLIVSLDSKIKSIALKLGADVPFLYSTYRVDGDLIKNSGGAVVSGIGETIEPIPINLCQKLHGSEAKILFPGTHLSTADIFKRYASSLKNKGAHNEMDSLLLNFVSAYRSNVNSSVAEESIQTRPHLPNITTIIDNDLAPVVVKACPKIGEILSVFNQIGGIESFLTGTGSSIVLLPTSEGVFDKNTQYKINEALTDRQIKYFDGKLQVY